MSTFEITLLEKRGGLLSKTIRLEDGKRQCDTSDCWMAKGRAWRVSFDTMGELGGIIGRVTPAQALALGTMIEGVADEAHIVSKLKLQTKFNGVARPNLITRSLDFFEFRPGRPALALIDFDVKGMPEAVRERVAALGGLWRALVSVLPALEQAPRVMRASTSAGLFYDSPELVRFPHSGGMHVYVAVQDGADIPRFLKALHQRCWLAGLGWIELGAAGQTLERSLVDVTVGSPERLVFEGAARVMPPLQQDAQEREPVAVEGAPSC